MTDYSYVEEKIAARVRYSLTKIKLRQKSLPKMFLGILGVLSIHTTRVEI